MAASLTPAQMRELAKLLPSLKADVSAQDAVRHEGELEKGNVELGNRPTVMHPDGSYSTLYSASFHDKGKEVLIPTVGLDGRMLNMQQAIDEYRSSGRHLGKFATPQQADAAGEALHAAGAKISDPIAAALRSKIAAGDTAGIYQAPMLDDDAMRGAAKDTPAMADALTLTDAQRQAILLHLQAGGDPAHVAAVAGGAITPALAQQMATQTPDSSAALLNPEQMRVLAAVNQPTDGSVPVSPEQLAAAQTAMSAPAAAPQVTSVEPSLPASPRGAATSLINTLGTTGQNTLQKGAEVAAAIPESAKRTAEAGVIAAQVEAKYNTKLDTLTHGVLERGNKDIGDIDQRENDALQLRQDTMDRVLRQMLDSANDVAKAAPHDFWADKSTSSRIFGVLSQIAGGMANGLANQPGQPTPLDRVIQRDLDEQRLEFAQKSQTGNQASGIYNDLVKATGSTTAAFGALRIAAYKRVLGQIEEMKTQNPELKNNAELAKTVHVINQKLTDTLSTTAKALDETGINAQKDALSGATSMANNDADNATARANAKIAADAKIGAAKAAEQDTYERDGIIEVPGKHRIPIPKGRAEIIDKTRAAYNVIKEQTLHIEGVLKDDGALQEDVKIALLGQAKATIVRELGAGFNAGNRPSDIYDAMVAGGAPKTAAQSILSYLNAAELTPNATMAALNATVASLKSNVNAELRPFNRMLDE